MVERVIAGRPGGPGFHWIDAEAATDDEVHELLRARGVALPLPAQEPRMPRPAIIEEEDFVLVLLVGADGGGGLAEVRCLAGPDWLLTLHARPLPALDAVTGAPDTPAAGLAALAKGLVTGLVDLVRELDDRVERIEDGATDEPLPIRRRLTSLRRVVLNQRDVLTRLGGGDGPATRDDPASRSLRNSSERMAQVGVEVETLREALHDATTDRTNDIVKRLTLVAAIFVPLTFITGFFGQNFGWMVRGIDGPGAFWLLGIVLPALGIAALLLAFRRNRWL